MVHAGAGEELAAAGLRSEIEIFRISTVEWNGEAQREIPLEPRCVVTDEMCAFGIEHQRAHLFEQTWTLKQLQTERTRRSIVGRHQRQTAERVAWNDALQ